MIKKLLSFSGASFKVTLMLLVVGFGLMGASFDQNLTGAFLTSTITAANNIIGSDDFPDDTCTPGQVWLANVESSSQGLRKNNTAITDPNRTDPTKTLGANDATTTSNFYSLGNDGVLVASFANQVEDGAGNDFSVYEVTNGRATYPIELATVEISQDGTNWITMPTPASSRPTGVTSYDLTTVGVPWFQYIRITDTTDFGPHAADADGFDVDAVSAAYGNCDNDGVQGRTISGLKFNDENQNGTNDSESGLSGWTIYAATQIASFNVEAASTPPVSTPVLANGETYLIRVTGTYDANDSITADAQYSVRSPNTTWTDSVQNYEGYGPTLLDLQIDGSSPNWGSYNADHTYWIPVTGTGVSKSLELYDLDNGNNNSGSLAVSVYHVLASDVTDSSGNYSLTVPLLSENVYVFEQMQDGWTQTLPGNPNYYYSTVTTDGNVTRDFGNYSETPTGNLRFTKYVCAQDAVVTPSQRPDANGNFPVPANCELQAGARFGYIFQEDKTDLSAPYPGLTDSTPFTALGGSTDGSGVLLTSLMPSDGRYMVAELDGSDNRIPDSELLGFLCTGDAGLYTNNYEATFIPENGTAYCSVFNRVPDTSVVLNEILPDPQATDSAAMPQGEWVELYNNSNFPINVNGWVLSAGSSSTLTISASNSDNNGNPFDSGETIVPADGALVVYRDGSGTFSIDEAGDTINLHNGATLIDTHTFTGPIAEEKSLARMPDGTGAWMDPYAQPGRENADELTDLDPFVKIWQQDANNAVVGLFEGLNYTSANYTITYTRMYEGQPKQEMIMDSFAIDNNNKYLLNIPLGSESEGVFTFHTGISDVKVDVTLQPGTLIESATLEGTWAP